MIEDTVSDVSINFQVYSRSVVSIFRDSSIWYFGSITSGKPVPDFRSAATMKNFSRERRDNTSPMMDSGYRARTRRIIRKHQSIRDDQRIDRISLISPTTMTSVSAAQTGTSERELIAAKTTSDDDRWQTTSLTSLTFPSASPVPLTSCQLPRTPRHTTSLLDDILSMLSRVFFSFLVYSMLFLYETHTTLVKTH